MVQRKVAGTSRVFPPLLVSPGPGVIRLPLCWEGVEVGRGLLNVAERVSSLFIQNILLGAKSERTLFPAPVEPQ